MLKKLTLVIWCALLLGFSFGSSVLAASDNHGLDAAAKKANFAIGSANNISSLVALAVNVFLSLLGIIFFVLIAISGLRWMTAQGNEERVTKARDTIQAAVVGLVITMAAYAITNFVISRLNI